MADGSLLVVVQRYGDVAGGAEAHARELVRRLVEHFDVTVATTTARDYRSWRNEFMPGETRVDGIPVHRFPVERGRARAFKSLEADAFDLCHALTQERAFIDAQGPVVPDLLDFINAHGREFDHVLFFTYIYYPTVYGLPLVPERAVLVPTAHDEPALRLTMYKPVFHAPRAIAYNTLEERELVRRRFRNERVPGAVVGVGVELPADRSAARFRAAHGIEGPILLYVGRVVESKGAPELFDYFTRWSDERRKGNATLVVIGHAEMPIPKRPDVVHLGYATDETKFDAFAACDALIVPERYSSLSMVTLEGWASGRPVVCSAYCNVLTGMSLRADAGLAYGSYAEFAEICDLLVEQHDLGDRLGARGREFVESTYTWPRVVETYRDLFAEVRARNA